MFENDSLDATQATVRIDLTVSADPRMLPPEAGLPGLPAFAITLHLPARPLTPATRELARTVRDCLSQQRRTG